MIIVQFGVTFAFGVGYWARRKSFWKHQDITIEATFNDLLFCLSCKIGAHWFGSLCMVDNILEWMCDSWGFRLGFDVAKPS